MTTTIEDKVTLVRKRAELVEILAGPLPVEDRVRIQGELSVVNAQIKALNTTAAAQLKAAADRRRAAGMAEAQANAARARARVIGLGPEGASSDDDDPDQEQAINEWAIAVLHRAGIKTHRPNSDGPLFMVDVPQKWSSVIDALWAGLHAVARGEELPDLAPPTPAPKAKKRS